MKTARSNNEGSVLIVDDTAENLTVLRQMLEEHGYRIRPALNEMDDKVKAFSVGGADYISKPFKAEEVLSRVATHCELKRYRDHLEQLP